MSNPSDPLVVGVDLGVDKPGTFLCAGTPRLVDTPLAWSCWEVTGVGIYNAKAIGKFELFGKSFRPHRRQGKSLSGYKGSSGRRKVRL